MLTLHSFMSWPGYLWHSVCAPCSGLQSRRGPFSRRWLCWFGPHLPFLWLSLTRLGRSCQVRLESCITMSMSMSMLINITTIVTMNTPMAMFLGSLERCWQIPRIIRYSMTLLPTANQGALLISCVLIWALCSYRHFTRSSPAHWDF